MLHVNCKIAVFQEHSNTYRGKDGHKGYNQVLINNLHCSVDHEMVLRAQELAPSGIMLIILSQNAIFTKQSKDFKIWHLKGSGQDLKKN